MDITKYSRYNNSFIFKLAIFWDICSRVDFPSEVTIKANYTMLKSLSLDKDDENISMSAFFINFEPVCKFISNLFERFEYKQSILL